MFVLAALLALGAIPAALSAPLSSPLPADLHTRQLPSTPDYSSPINASLPNITVFTTGGTIASQGSTSTQTIGYSVGLGLKQLVEAVPEVLNVSNIYGYGVSNVASGNVNQTVLLNLTKLINRELAKPEISGVVVTHGTDSLEETAFFLDMTVQSTKPVVVVGAMRPATALSADGPLNLFQAVTLATSKNARGRGAMITLNDRIGSAFFTTKNNANSLDTFFSTEAGQLGFFINQVPYFYFSPAIPVGKPNFDLSSINALPKVDILYAHQEMDADLISSAEQNGAKGIVFASMGAGALNTGAYQEASGLYNATGMPIVASHRSVDGFVPGGSSSSYMIAGGFLNPQKCRIMVQLGLVSGFNTTAMRELFANTYPDASF